jgi:tRNA (guanine37-N1)-methyltransferase
VYEFGLVALFPEIVEPVLRYGVLGRACEEGICRLTSESPRTHTTDRHRTVDDRPYGGGPGMVLRYEPVMAALSALKTRMPVNTRCIALSAQGQRFDQAQARRLAKEGSIILLAARYEGIDERVLEHVDAELSIGDYVLSGGEPAAAVVIDAVTRLLPGVLGHADSASDDSFMDGLLGYPQYTRPEQIGDQAVPAPLLSGDHARVRRWRLKQALGRTWLRRPDLLEGRPLSDAEQQLLEEYREEYLDAQSGPGSVPNRVE